MTDVEIRDTYIELNKLLKFEGLVESGGQAKQLIADGYVFVNDQECRVVRKKLVNGDVVDFNGHVMRIKAQQS